MNSMRKRNHKGGNNQQLTLAKLQAEIRALRRTPETKAFVAANSAQNLIGTVGSIVPLSLCAMSQGTDQQQRVGDTIHAKQLLVSYQVTYNTVPVGPQYTRIVIFQDLRGQFNQVPTWSATGSGVFESTGYSSADVGNLGRYRILHDKVHILDSIDHYGAWDRFVLPINSDIHYEGSGSTSYSKGALWIMYYSNQTVNFPTINYNTQLRYVDY